MNKKIIVFICILSLLVPFLPQFDFIVHADGLPNVSNDNLDEWREWLAENGLMQDPQTGQPVPISDSPISLAINKFLFDNGYVVKDDFSIVVDSLQGITGINILEHGGLDSLKSYAENNDFPNISQNIINYSIIYAENNLTYYIYDFISVDDFFNNYNFSNYLLYGYNLSDFKSALSQVVSDSDSVYIAFTPNGIFQGNIFKFSRSYFDNNFLYLSEGDFYGFNTYKYQIFEQPDIYTSTPTLGGRLSFSDGLSSVSVDAVNYQFYVNSSGQYSHFNILFTDNSNQKFYCGGNIQPFNRIAFTSTVGSFFLTSGDSFSIPVFKSANLISDFKRGDASVYQFDSSVIIPDGASIDYSRLYDIISTEVSHSSGNVIQAINNAADNYLQQQIDLLHDINNALNDGTGQSWLRRIYGILDYNFPLTLQAFEDLHYAIQNISISGGASDLSHINRVLDEINDKLGFMIEEPLSNADIENMEDLKNLAQQKFPFCVFSDIVAISVILNQTPEQPHWQIPLKLPGSSSANNIDVDLSWYENVRDLVQGVFIFIFIVGLLALSVKIFSALKS